MANEPLGPVRFYEGRFYALSNFASFAVNYKGVLWMTSEHAYQAEKFTQYEIREEIRLATSAHEAKQIAKRYDSLKRKDWQDIKLSVMEAILRAKFEQHEYVRRTLSRTEGREIIEDSPYDSFWGRGPDHTGENHLGKLWMKLRDEMNG